MLGEGRGEGAVVGARGGRGVPTKRDGRRKRGRARVTDSVDSAGRFGIGRRLARESNGRPGAARGRSAKGVKVSCQGVSRSQGVQLGSALRVAPPGRCGAKSAGPAPDCGEGVFGVEPLDSLINRFTYAVSAPTSIPSTPGLRRPRVEHVSGPWGHLWAQRKARIAPFSDNPPGPNDGQIPRGLWAGPGRDHVTYHTSPAIRFSPGPCVSCQLGWVRSPGGPKSPGPLLHRCKLLQQPAGQ